MSALRSLALLGLAWGTSAQAMDFSLGPPDENVFIYATGEIVSGDAQRFGEFLAALPPPGDSLTFVVFNSQGGLIDEALVIAKAVERNRILTGVAVDGQCTSACVLAWAAGARKFSHDGVCIGVHSANADIRAKAKAHSADEKKARRNLESTANVLMARWLFDHAAPVNVTTKLLQTPSSKVYCLTAADLAAWNVRITQ